MNNDANHKFVCLCQKNVICSRFREIKRCRSSIPIATGIKKEALFYVPNRPEGLLST